MKPPFFSIVLCTKNGSQYLKEQINSIVDQDFSDWELIIIDDLSKDITFQIATEFSKNDNRINCYQNRENIGVKNNFLINLAKAKGTWTVLCDQDDIWIPNKLNIIYMNIKERSSEDFFVHNGRYLVNDKTVNALGAFGKLIRTNNIVYDKKPNLGFFSLLYKNKVIGCFCCIRSAFIEKYVLFIPFSNTYHDHWIALIASISSNIVFIDFPLISYRRHLSTNTLINQPLLIRIKDRIYLLISLLINYLILLIKTLKNRFYS